MKGCKLTIRMENDIQKILFSEQTILARLDEIGWQISKDYEGKELSVIAIMNGSIMFMSDLLKRVRIPLQIDCWSISSYHGSKSSGNINFRQHDIKDVTNRHVLLLDDILDSGLTLYTIKKKILDETKALSVKSFGGFGGGTLESAILKLLVFLLDNVTLPCLVTYPLFDTT